MSWSDALCYKACSAAVTGAFWHMDETNYLTVALVWPEVDGSAGEEKALQILCDHLGCTLKTIAVSLLACISGLSPPPRCLMKKEGKKKGGRKEDVVWTRAMHDMHSQPKGYFSLFLPQNSFNYWAASIQSIINNLTANKYRWPSLSYRNKLWIIILGKSSILTK